jgi:hypothetical protein
MLTILYIALAVLLLIDWRQTLVIALPGGWWERNPAIAWLIERYGANGVHLWFTLACVLLAAALYLLPDWRLAIAISACTAEAVCVANNFSRGIWP